jgi:hypothetical protein
MKLEIVVISAGLIIVYVLPTPAMHFLIETERKAESPKVPIVHAPLMLQTKKNYISYEHADEKYCL